MADNKKYYEFIFSNGERHTMTPLEGNRYAHKHKLDIFQGPNYVEGRKEKAWDGWGWHSSLQMSFKGPKHYRDYLRANNMEEWGNEDSPQHKEFRKPVWDEALIRKAINEHGIPIGSVLAEALISGEIDYPEG